LAKRISISFSDYIYEQYLQSAKLNRSKYIEEMFVKGVNFETQEFQGQQTKIVQMLRQLREKDEVISNLQRELASVKSRVVTQEMRREEKRLAKEKEEASKWRVLE
jgi:alpha-glucuronidase